MDMFPNPVAELQVVRIEVRGFLEILRGKSEKVRNRLVDGAVVDILAQPTTLVRAGLVRHPGQTEHASDVPHVG